MCLCSWQGCFGCCGEIIKTMKIAIVANGRLEDHEFHNNILKNCDQVIAADGGANNCEILGIIPNYVIGDMDSISSELLAELKKKAKVIIDPDQNKTDVELALELAHSLVPSEVILLCAIGTRIDHTLANIMCLARWEAKVIDPHNEIQLVTDSTIVRGSVGDTVSIVPLSPIKGLTYSGLKWKVEDMDTPFGWFGICNNLSEPTAKIALKQGKILVMKTRD